MKKSWYRRMMEDFMNLLFPGENGPEEFSTRDVVTFSLLLLLVFAVGIFFAIASS